MTDERHRWIGDAPLEDLQAFAERYLAHAGTGAPLELEPWQRRLLEGALEPVDWRHTLYLARRVERSQAHARAAAAAIIAGERVTIACADRASLEATVERVARELAAYGKALDVDVDELVDELRANLQR